MKSTVCLILTLWFGIYCRALAEPPRSHQWIELPLSDGSAWCDLAQASEIWFVGDGRVTADQHSDSENGPGESHLLFEDNAVAAQIVLKVVQAAPERWLQIDPASRPAGVRIFLNLDAVAAVYFKTDEKGAYARVVMQGQTVLNPHQAVKNPFAGSVVRLPADIERLKKLFTAH